MGLADRLAEATPTPHPNAGCGVGRLWSSYDDPDDRDALRDFVFGRPDLTAPDKSRWLADELGVQILSDTITGHVRGDCRCDAHGWCQPDG